MHIGQLVAYFFGGFFLCNALPHYLSSVMGRSFCWSDMVPAGAGFIGMGLLAAKLFGRFHGGERA